MVSPSRMDEQQHFLADLTPCSLLTIVVSDHEKAFLFAFTYLVLVLVVPFLLVVTIERNTTRTRPPDPYSPQKKSI